MGLLCGPAGLNSDSPRVKRKRTTGRLPHERKKERGPALWLGCFSWGWLDRSLLSHYAGNRQICGPAINGPLGQREHLEAEPTSPRASLYHRDSWFVFFGKIFGCNLFCLNNQNAQHILQPPFATPGPKNLVCGEI